MLGPGFDTVALAMELFLDLDATPADRFHIELASGRDAEVISSLDHNMFG